MKVAVYDTHLFEKTLLAEKNIEIAQKLGQPPHLLRFFSFHLDESSVDTAKGFDAVCVFTNDHVTGAVLNALSKNGIKLIALRCAGFNQVDLVTAQKLGIPVVRVPAYSPYAVAEHAVGLILTLNRKFHRSYLRIKESNFSLDGLTGFDLHGKTVGIIGTGKIGSVFAKIMHGFGCKLLGYDPAPQATLTQEYGLKYCELPELYQSSDIISLHLPLKKETHHLMGATAFSMIKKGALLINTGRGGLIDTTALIASLKSGNLGGAGLDVYEEEEDVFFVDHSDVGIQDDRLARLTTFPNVVITSHQAFLTQEALTAIAETTLNNLWDYELRQTLKNRVPSP